MTQNVPGFRFAPPAGFEAQEWMVTLSGPAVEDLKDPRMLQKQHPVRPNLILHRRTVGASPSLDLLCGEVCAELLSGVEGMQNLNTAPFPFEDGVQGRLVSFDFGVKLGAVRQFQAMRLDGAVFTTLTLTVDAATLSDRTRDGYLKSLSAMGSPV